MTPASTKKVLLISPPRKYWPFMSEYDNFMLPLWMPCLAPVAEKLGWAVRCIDCMAEKIGWKSLEELIVREKPDVIALSESHALYIHEHFKFIRMIKRCLPDCKIIAGGGHYSNLALDTLRRHDVDIIGVGEGEDTFREILQHFEAPEKLPLEKIKGIAYRKDGVPTFTPPRPLIHDLNQLPEPGWKFMSMEKYGASRFLFSPGGMCFFHSRGCIASCNFCVWWTTDAQRKILPDLSTEFTPKWRTKSPERTVDEIEEFVKKYDKRFFVFVDATWNVLPKWTARFCELVKERKLDIYWMAFMRTDYLLRDEKLGLLEKMVEAGLSHVLIGIEHPSEKIFADYEKHNQDSDQVLKLVRIFQKKYPKVFVQGTFIVGGENESQDTLKELLNYAKLLRLDYAAVHTLTPFPGTKYYDRLVRAMAVTEEDFEKFDLNTATQPTKHLTIEELQYGVYLINKELFTIRWLIRGLFSKSHYKRSMYLWGILVSFKMVFKRAHQLLFFKKQMFGLVEPQWYAR